MFGFNPEIMKDDLYHQTTSKLANGELKEDKKTGVFQFSDGTAACFNCDKRGSHPRATEKTEEKSRRTYQSSQPME